MFQAGIQGGLAPAPQHGHQAIFTGAGQGHIGHLHGRVLNDGLTFQMACQQIDKGIDLNRALVPHVHNLRSMCQLRASNQTSYGLHNVVDIGEVASQLALAKDLDGQTSANILSEHKRRHVGSSPWAVDGKKSHTQRCHAVLRVVGIGHHFIGHFGGSIKRLRLIGTVCFHERDLAAHTVNAGGTGVQESGDLQTMTSVQHMGETHQIGCDKIHGRLHRMPDTCLRCQMHHRVGLPLCHH